MFYEKSISLWLVFIFFNEIEEVIENVDIRK
jgi:hypothetical protein